MLIKSVLFSKIWVGLVSFTMAEPSPKFQKKFKLSPWVVLVKSTVIGPQSVTAFDVNEGVGMGNTEMVSKIVSEHPNAVKRSSEL